MIIGEIIGWLIIGWLAYAILSVGFHIIRQGGQDARDMIGCFAYPLIMFAIAVIIAFSTKGCRDESKENAIVKQESQTTNEV